MNSRVYEIVKKHKDVSEQVRTVMETTELLESPEVVAYLLKQSLSIFRDMPDLHLDLMGRVPEDVVCSFAPGLLSGYFRILKGPKNKSSVRSAAVEAVKYVLSRISGFDEESEKNIHEFFYFNGEEGFGELYAICAQKFKTSRRVFFMSRLLLLDHPLSEDEYRMLNERMEEVFSPEVVSKLVSIGRYENNEAVFGRLVDMYHKGAEVGEIISRIQDRHQVEGCVLELCPVNEATMREVLATNDLRKIEVFLRNTDHVPLHVDVVKKFLELGTSSDDILRSNFGRRFGIARMVSEDYDELLEYAFNRMDTDARVLINLINIEFRPKVDEFVFQCIDLIYRNTDLERLGQYLYFLKVVVEKNCLRRSVLRRMFDGLVYLDHEDHRVRCGKYEILSGLLGQYFLMDEWIEVQKETSSRTAECGMSGRIDSCDIDTDNVKVLAATLWDELNIVPVDGELMAVSYLLKKIVDVTGTFYESRITRSNLIFHLIERHGIDGFSEVRRGRMDAFLGLLGSVITSFHMSKDVFNRVFLVLMDYFHLFDTKRLMEMMVRKDKYHCLYIVHKRLARGRMSENLRRFLKKTLLEAP